MDLNNTLSFFGKQLKLDTEEEISKVIDQIRKHLNLEVLDFRGNTLSVLAGKLIAESLKTRRELKECIWSDMFTGRLKDEIPLVLDALGEALTASGCRLTTLDLSDNAFGAGLSTSLYNFLQSPALYSLENLILNNNGLGLAGKTVGKALCSLIDASKKAGTPLKLKKFVCGRNRLEVESTIALSDAFIKLGTLEEIRLPQNGIRDDGIIALAEAFRMNKKLRIIDINDNFCCPEGAIQISEVLSDLQFIEVLDLGDCVCDDPGVLAIIAELDKINRDCLKKVVLSGNNITSDVIDEIGACFNSPKMCHVKVDISVNMFGKDFDSAKARHGKGNIDFGRRGDDELLSSDEEEEQGAEDASMEEDAFNTSRETVIDRSNLHEASADEMMNDLMNKGFGCMKIEDNQQNSNGNGMVSFLDKSLKLDTAESAEPVVKVIAAASSMKALELRGNTLGIAAGNVIAKALESHPELERCLWSDLFTGRLKNEIPPILEALGKAMMTAGCKIKELDLSDNAFGPIGADALKDLLESPSSFSLEVLKLNNNGLGIGGKQIAKSLTECLRKSIAVGGENRLRLKTFIAGRNRLENPGAHALAATFKALETVEWFDVRQNGIHEEGIRALVAALKHNRNLRYLWLEDNTVLPKGAKALAKTLESWPKLEVLNLSDCLIRDAGCNYIIDHLNPQHHRHLKNVYLCGNELTPPVAKLLIQKWSKFDGLTPKPVLHIHTNSFGDEFSDVAGMAPENVNVGDEDDDLGSLDGDQEEYNSKSSDSEDADLDDDDEDDDEEAEIQIIDNGESQLKLAMDRIDRLDIDFESRFQEDTARVILQLSAPLKSCKMSEPALQRAIEVAENIVRRVESVKRNPIPATTQLVNNIVAQCAGTGVKTLQAETDWGYGADPQVISRLFSELVARGHFKLELALLQRFFPSQ
ncbi:Ran GTPase-activating protein 2 [Caenorhabditis elegans]|uniref:Isoform b of Ran GTPase-activating protein 2 n=1 Tax=Caenorhabditis elegans TaxID=6239 RepID=P34342-2|nr:Ran GTPase-activating protein 2 [Caenorhabditis elegans]CCD66005.1 Ran GTPase-activating protein 2 [Caenorhabditis elegans]|eukprot:NP_741232.1 Ran GTPase-activating protein 2 [Caenorhabditis elegans]